MADEYSVRIEQVASIMYAAALAFTNNIGRKGWSWEAADAETKRYWRQMAQKVYDICTEVPRA